MLRGIKIIPVMAGVALDWYLTLVLSTFLGACVAFNYGIQHPGTASNPSHWAGLSHSTFIIVAGHLLGTGCSILGGFITGWMAKIERIKNGVAMGIVSAITSGLMMHFTEHHDALYEIFVNSVTVGAGTLGGYLAKLAYDRPPLPPPVNQRA